MNNLRRKGMWYDLTQDGRFKNERIKGKTKRNIRKWTMRMKKKVY